MEKKLELEYKKYQNERVKHFNLLFNSLHKCCIVIKFGFYVKMENMAQLVDIREFFKVAKLLYKR